MELDAGTRCFCLRRVNPFLGLVAVVKTEGGRALSIDGRHWQIQVQAQPPRGLWTRGGEQAVGKYFRFGAWSEAEGITRVPLNPVLDAGLMLAASQSLVTQVRRATPALPFPMAQELEHWLLDTQGRPLALLGTALAETDLDETGGSDWRAGGRGEGRPFRSPTLAAEGVPERDGSGRRFHVEAVERLIAQAAGPRRLTQWFRPAGGDAQGLSHRTDPALANRRLPRSAFPALTFRTDWPEEAARRLVRDYVAWLAPYLLALPDLPETTRDVLERASVHHALLVDALWRLYPHFINGDLLNRVRVEACLRHAGT
jgi:hypothetical protein